MKSEGKVGLKVRNRQLSLIGMFGLCGAATSHPATLQETFHPKLLEHILIIKFNIPLTRRCEVTLLFPVY